MSRNTLKRGDHLYVDYGPFIHHGIYYGYGEIIHYSEGAIRKEPLSKFTRGRRFSVKRYHRSSAPKKVISRAKRRLNEREYNFFFNNCEHFARWCKTGRRRCKQMERFDQAGPKLVQYYGRRTGKTFSKVVGRLLKGRLLSW